MNRTFKGFFPTTMNGNYASNFEFSITFSQGKYFPRYTTLKATLDTINKALKRLY